MEIPEIFSKLKIIIVKLFNRALLKFYSSGSLGYLIGSLGGGKDANQPGRIPSFIFNIGDWQIHFHHWLIGLMILLSIFLLRFKKKKISFFTSVPLFGFLLGLILHGIITYDDWNDVLIKIK